jgi:hypothetical protein
MATKYYKQAASSFKLVKRNRIYPPRKLMPPFVKAKIAEIKKPCDLTPIRISFAEGCKPVAARQSIACRNWFAAYLM